LFVVHEISESASAKCVIATKFKSFLVALKHKFVIAAEPEWVTDGGG
jgi:hypothetical protein